MYEQFYGLREKPFSLLPDPTFLYPSEKHSMALVLLEYGLSNQTSFSVITGGIGTGKTTLIRQLLDRRVRMQRAVWSCPTRSASSVRWAWTGYWTRSNARLY